MAEQKMTYQERLEKTRKDLQAGQIDYVFKNTAKKVIRREAEAIREYEKALPYSEFRRSIDHYLLEHGYIEPKTEDDGE